MKNQHSPAKPSLIKHDPAPLLMPCAGHRKYVLMEPWEYQVNEHQLWIPAGFEFDGASIPRGCWYTTYSPFNPIVMTAALEHDHLCVMRPSFIAYDVAAKHFRDRLTKAGSIRRELMYRAVLWFGPKWGQSNGS